jgi:hypothetical protein
MATPKELGNQCVKATDIPVIAFSVGEEELTGVDTKPLVGHLTAWSYFESVDSPENKVFIKKWHNYTKDPRRMRRLARLRHLPRLRQALATRAALAALAAERGRERNA